MSADRGTTNVLESMSLNDLLEQIDNGLGKLGKTGGVVPKSILLEMDQANSRINDGISNGRELRAEIAQFEFIGKNLQNYAGLFIKLIGGRQALQQLRMVFKPTEAQWWWFLDKMVDEKRRKNIKKYLIIASAGTAIFIVLMLLYNRFLAPDPITQQRYNLINDAQALMMKADYPAAMIAIDQGLVNSPTDSDLLIYKGVLLVKLDQVQQAGPYFNQAEKVLGSHENLLLARSMIYLQMGDPKSTLADAQETIQDNPNSAEGNFYFGKANELLGNNQEALTYYQIAAGLAEQQNKAALTATIKINEAMLLQALNSQMPSPQPTITK
jgi:tetratricopeptide (TPR) repeat protein